MAWATRLSQPILSEDAPDGMFLLKRELVVDTGEDFGADYSGWAIAARPRRTVITIKAGLLTDFASISPVLQATVAGKKRKYRNAAVLHDAAYARGIPRGLADRIFRHVSRSGNGVGPIRGFFVWAGLRLGGWAAYRSHSRRRERG